ncbi:DUF1302 domain-containing protein [Acidocella sp.]|uniref:DUF1302 domain-containing protein n=1 Tax=Acidocella sp. TaxID=50710 RepID=UPI002623CCF3|nr:DUF1302 family protein [Acidocella sp.]
MKKQKKCRDKLILPRTALHPGVRAARGVPAQLVIGTCGIFLSCVPQGAAALNLYNGQSHGNNLEINLDTTIAYTGIVRTNNPSQVLIGPNNINGDDGDRNLAHGLVSNEFEILPILDIRDGDWGAHFSGDAYINTPYLGTNQNDSPGTNNPLSIPKNNDFTSATRNVEGLNAQMLDAFVYGTKTFGEGGTQSVTLKVGRQTLLWGQSLFLSNNGIAAGMAPFDVITADNTPNAQTQQIILPVGQVVATYQPNSVVTLQGYYQFQWQPDFLEGAGSFFSSVDILDKGGQRLLFAPYYGIPREQDIRPPSQNGQFGVAAEFTEGAYDFGLYTLRYDSKAPTVYLSSTASSYRVVYPRDIWIEGTSLSTTFGPVNVGGETSFRQHMNLVTGANVSSTNNVNSNPAYPVGDTWAGQVSAIYLSPGLPFDPGGLSVDGEIGFNHVLSVTANKNALPSGANGGLPRTPTAADMEVVVTPNYYSVLPHLDVAFPIGITYNLFGRSQVDATENHGTGSFTAGITATYNVTWIANLTFYDNIGAPNPLLSGEPSVADRNYVLLNLQHSF